MKDAKTYEKKVRKLLSGAKSPGKPEPVTDRIRFVIEAIVQADASAKQAKAAMDLLEKEFVDYNELRVSPPKELRERMGKGFPLSGEKCYSLSRVLNAIFEHASKMSLDYLDEMSKRDIRRHLRELGLPPFAEALVAIRCFDIHAVPVDESLFDLLMLEGMIHESSDIADTQGFLERIVAQKNNLAAHAAFRAWVDKNAAVLAKHREEQAAQRAAEEEARLREAAEKRRAEREARKQREQEEQEEEFDDVDDEDLEDEEAPDDDDLDTDGLEDEGEDFEGKAAGKADPKSAAAKKTAKKTAKAAPKTTPKKAAKKATKTAPKKAVKKVAKKTAKKASGSTKRSKPAAKKATKKAAKKTTKRAGKKK